MGLRQAALGLLGGLLSGVLGGHASAGAADGRFADAPPLQIEVARPASGAHVGGTHGLTLVTGRAVAFARARVGVDVVVVLDVSESTLDPFVPDVEGDGAAQISWWRRVADTLRGRKTPRGPSLLDTEIRVVERLIERLDPRHSRVGIVAFSGDWDPHTPDAWTEVPLTSDFAELRRGLERLAQQGPVGATNAVAGIHRGLAELLGTPSARGRQRQGTRRAILLVTDGLDVHPFYPERSEALRVAAASVRRVLQADVRIDAVVVGANPEGQVGFPELAAQESGGTYTEVGRPGQLEALFGDLDYTELREVVVHNRTSDERVPALLRQADGGFAALVRLERGHNLIEVRARTSDGFAERAALELYWDPDAEADPTTDLEPVEIAWRTRLLAEHLRALQLPAEAPARSRRRALEVRVPAPTPDESVPAAPAEP